MGYVNSVEKLDAHKIEFTFHQTDYWINLVFLGIANIS